MKFDLRLRFQSSVPLPEYDEKITWEAFCSTQLCKQVKTGDTHALKAPGGYGHWIWENLRLKQKDTVL
jgi:hypothetical protein